MKKATLQSVARDIRAIARSVAAMNKPGKQAPAGAKLGQHEVEIGLTIHDSQPARLVLLVNEIDAIKPASWDEVMAYAKQKSASPPSRIDGLVLSQRAADRFKTDLPYWTSEQHAGDSSIAWAQWFGNGTQDYWTKDDKFRACLVRREPI